MVWTCPSLLRGQGHASCLSSKPSKPRVTPCPLGGGLPVSTSGPSETMSSVPERGVRGDALLWDSDLGLGLWVRPHLCDGHAEAHPRGEAGTPGVAAGTPGAGAAFSCSPLSQSPRPSPRPLVSLRGRPGARCFVAVPQLPSPVPAGGGGWSRAWGGKPVSSSPACSLLEAPAPAALGRDAREAARGP